ncbi:MAG: sugar kinase [Steroidobacteraceae bacterium]|nr:sugar kinase [Steroidobacteraceae bacterium]
MPRFDVTTYGEGGLRLSVPAGRRIETTTNFDVDVAGTEANVVGALSRLGWRCGWVSALPATAPGRRVGHALRAAGVDLQAVRWRDGGRVSCYYVEYAQPPRSTTVLYDRNDSCFAQLGAADVDWQYMLDTKHLHLTGLTYPLSGHTRSIIETALSRALAEGVSTSLDVNHRDQLWSAAQCRNELLPLCRDVGLLFCSRRDAQKVFGCDGAPEPAATRLRELTGARAVVMSLGDEGVIACGPDGTLRANARPASVCDRMGAGDALAAGVLHGWLRGDLSAGLRYGTTMAALALSQHGDMVVSDPLELDRLAMRDHYTDIER